jgi:hypothetical protein
MSLSDLLLTATIVLVPYIWGRNVQPVCPQRGALTRPPCVLGGAQRQDHGKVISSRVVSISSARLPDRCMETATGAES